MDAELRRQTDLAARLAHRREAEGGERGQAGGKKACGESELRARDGDHHLAPRDRPGAGAPVLADVRMRRAAVTRPFPRPRPLREDRDARGSAGTQHAVHQARARRHVHARLDDDFPRAGSGTDSYWHEAGWLCRELRTHDGREERDATAWGWDVTRPIAEQALEIKAQHNAIGALCDVVEQVGGTMRLYGVPVTESELRAHGEQLVDDKLARIATQNRPDVQPAEPTDDASVPGSPAWNADLDAMELAETPIDDAIRLPGRVPYAEDQLELPVVATALTPRTPTIEQLSADLELQRSSLIASTHPLPPLATPNEMREQVAVELVIGEEPEQGVGVETAPRPGAVAPPTTDVAPIADLIARSSVGVGLANIEENGIDVELDDIETDLADPTADALIAAIAHAPPREPSPRPVCTNNSPSWLRGHWRDWHRGHGCDLDDGKPRTADGAAEIAAGCDGESAVADQPNIGGGS